MFYFASTWTWLTRNLNSRPHGLDATGVFDGNIWQPMSLRCRFRKARAGKPSVTEMKTQLAGLRKPLASTMEVGLNWFPLISLDWLQKNPLPCREREREMDMHLHGHFILWVLVSSRGPFAQRRVETLLEGSLHEVSPDMPCARSTFKGRNASPCHVHQFSNEHPVHIFQCC